MGVAISDLIKATRSEPWPLPRCSGPSVVVSASCHFCHKRLMEVELAKNRLYPSHRDFSGWGAWTDLKLLAWHATHSMPENSKMMEISVLHTMEAVQELCKDDTTDRPYRLLTTCPSCGGSRPCKKKIRDTIRQRFIR